MLKYIKITNFLSFQEVTEINFESSNYWNKSWNVFSIAKDTLVKSMLIYGANASGKTNILKAVDFIRDFALFSHEKWFLWETVPFLLDKDSKNEPSIFELWYFVDEKEYVYHFEIFNEEVLKENLYEVKKWKLQMLFTRDKLEIIAGKDFENELEKWREKIRKDSSVIAVLSQWNGKMGEKDIVYFFSHIHVLLWEISMRGSAGLLKIQENPENKEFVLEFLRSADIKIDDIKITRESLPKEILEKLKDAPKEFINDLSIKVKFWHKNSETWEMIYFNLEEESDWTRKLFKLLWPIVDTIMNEWILFVDEIETNLHLHILQNIFKLIHSEKLQKKFQFIFTTHNVELMDLSVFKKEQIGLTKKDANGKTCFETLYDYNIRSVNDVAKMYNNGAFWWIPNVKDFALLLQEFTLWKEKQNDSL